jgi:hypothetical protein
MGRVYSHTFYGIHGDMNSSSLTGILPLYYLDRPIKCPLPPCVILLVSHESSQHNFTEHVFMDIFYISFEKERKLQNLYKLSHIHDKY